MKVNELRLPAEWHFPDAKQAVMAFLDAIHQAKTKNDCEPLQRWIDDHGTAPSGGTDA